MSEELAPADLRLAPAIARATTAKNWTAWVPGLQMLREYRLAWLRNDIMAGIVLSTMLVPVGIAYAVASGVPAINGLYATIVPLIVYALFGPSRILVLGPDSSLAPIILGVVLPLSAGDPVRAVALASAMAVVAGAVGIIAGIAKLGFVTELLSKPIRYGYMNGIALAVLISQLPKFFDMKIESSGPIRDLWSIGSAILGGKANWAAAALAAGTLIAILVMKAHKRMGAILIAVIAATAIAGWLHLSDKYGVKVLGPVPQGLPKFSIPWIGPNDVIPILTGGLAVAIVAFADTSVLSRTFAARAGSRVDPNQEMVGLGAANLAAGLFQGFAISSSSSRTPVAEAAGAKTQVTGVVGALVVAVVIIAAPMLFRNLPYSALAAVVIAAAIGLFEFADLGRIYRIQQWEFWLSILCTAGVAVFGAIPGIGIAIIVAVIEFLWDGWRPHWAVLGKPDGVDGFHDVSRYPNASRVPGLVIFRWDAPLFFANAELFGERIDGAVSASPSRVRRVVVSAAPITSVDVTSADALTELAATLNAKGVELCFAELKDPVKDKMKRFGLFTQFGEARFFPTIESAVSAYVRDYGVSWPIE
jgi:high affinity sulfate transporter 1